MLNFSGNATKKRNINLGNKSHKQSQLSYVEQIRIQREKRELARREEQYAEILQSHIRSYLDLRKEKSYFSIHWSDIEDIDKKVYAFCFFFNSSIPSQSIEQNLANVCLLSQILDNSIYAISDHTLAKTVQVLIKSLYKTKADIRSLVFLNKLVSNIQKVYNYNQELNYTNLIEVLTNVISNLQLHSIPIPSLYIPLILSLSESSLSQFARFLSTPGIHRYLSQSGNNLSLPISHIKNHLEELTTTERINLLSNLLYMFPVVNQSNVTGIIDIVCSIGPAISVATNLSNSRKSRICITDEQALSLEKLFTRETTSAFFSFFKSNQSLRYEIGRFYLTLIVLSPFNKNRLFTYITLQSDFDFLVDSIGGSSIYNRVSINKNEVFRIDDDDFWYNLLILEELSSYWLFISDNIDKFLSFFGAKNDQEKFDKFLRFLKNLSFNLLSNDPKLFESKLQKNIFNTSNKLLNQLYFKNLYLGFVPKDFWIIIDDINVENLSPYLESSTSSTFASVYTNVNSESDSESESDTEEKELSDSDDEDDNFYGRPKIPSSHQITLRVLQTHPFLIPFRTRLSILQSLISNSQNHGDFPIQQKLTASISRSHILIDAFNQFYELGSKFTLPLSITFVSEEGGVEVGIDGGGITKEFLTSICNEVLSVASTPNANDENISIDTDDNPKLLGRKLFEETNSHVIFPNRTIGLKLMKRLDMPEMQQLLKYLKFFGMIVGRCIFSSVLIDYKLAVFFLGKFRNKSSIDDLMRFDIELYKNLMSIVDMDGIQLAELDLNFTIDEKVDGIVHSFELIPGGKGIKVDTGNKLNYIHEVGNFILNKSLNCQTKAFMEGLFEVVPVNWLLMFDAHELQMLISGENNDVDIEDWRKNTEYGGYFENDSTIKLFWEVVKEFDPSDRCKLIKFVTSVGRAPLLGFGALHPKFGIRNSGSDVDRLPTASTCVNLFKLPDYNNKELIRQKILYAINMDAGFELS